MTDGERSIYRLSKEYMKVRVTEPTNEFSADNVQVKIGRGEWRETEVLTSRDATTGMARVGLVVEPAVDGLPVGNHEILARLVDNPEAPVMHAGTLTVT